VSGALRRSLKVAVRIQQKAVQGGRRTARVRTELRATLLLSESKFLSEEPTMSPFVMIDLARTIESDRRRESQIATAARRLRSGRRPRD
jgi:hypothetical protein